MTTRASRVVEDLKALIKRETRLRAGLPPATERDEIPAEKGTGYAAKVAAGGSTSGLAFPLTEDITKRAGYPDRYKWDTSGIFSLVWYPHKKCNFTDATGSSGDINYGDPDA